MMLKKMLFIAGFFGALAIVSPCGAQPPSDSNIFFDAPGLLPKKPKPGAPDVKASPLAWPRLDAGAVLCRSEADLLRLADRRRGEAVEGPVDCQILRAVTPITIVQRKGPGRTEVQTADPKAGGSGWTDAYLPQKAPVSAASAAR
ncbi:MAG: hypothetical protein QOG73_1316 [Acetobacteraceae bacterium]|nr:hypothetical protein [Acetobacteraceae bacterium]